MRQEVGDCIREYNNLKTYKPNNTNRETIPEKFRNTDFDQYLKRMLDDIDRMKTYYDNPKIAALGFDKVRILMRCEDELNLIDFRLKDMVNTNLSKEILGQKKGVILATMEYTKNNISLDELSAIVSQNKQYDTQDNISLKSRSGTGSILDAALKTNKETLLPASDFEPKNPSPGKK